MGEHWSDAFPYLTPLLCAVTVMLWLCRCLMLWQRERAWRPFWFMMVYTGLLVVLVARSFNLGSSLVAFGYALLVVVITICNFYEWSGFYAYIRERKKPKPDGMVIPYTLENLAAEGTPVTLDASPKSELREGESHD